MQAVPELTSKRVLTMEYMDGVGLNDLQGLKDLGADPAEVSPRARQRLGRCRKLCGIFDK